MELRFSVKMWLSFKVRGEHFIVYFGRVDAGLQFDHDSGWER